MGTVCEILKIHHKLTGNCCTLVTLFNNWGASSCPGNGVTSLGKNPGYDVNYEKKKTNILNDTPAAIKSSRFITHLIAVPTANEL